MIAVLCVNSNSVYKTIPGLDCYDAERDAYTFTGSCPVIAHAPCQQWSRLRAFSKANEYEKQLAFFCLEKVQSNGGIFEHPHGSSFFKAAGVKPTICIDQHWFGFPGRKRTWLYFVGCKPLSFPLSFDLPQIGDITNMKKSRRSDTTPQFAQYLIDCVKTC